MDVRVAGHQVETGESLRDHAQRRVGEIIEKYFARSVGANITFGRGPNNDFTCDIVAPVTQGVVLKSSYSAREAEIAFNGAADRIEKQLRRYTNRLKEHKVDESETRAFVENAGYTIFSAPPDFPPEVLDKLKRFVDVGGGHPTLTEKDLEEFNDRLTDLFETISPGVTAEDDDDPRKNK